MHPADLIRWIVVLEAAATAVVYGWRITRIAYGLTRVPPRFDPLAGEFTVGRMLRAIGVTILLVQSALEVLAHLGHPLTWRLFALQAAIIALLGAFQRIDHRMAETTAAAPAAADAIERLADEERKRESR